MPLSNGREGDYFREIVYHSSLASMSECFKYVHLTSYKSLYYAINLTVAKFYKH